MRIVAVDPGETTGFAVYDEDAEEVVNSGELFGNFRSCVEYIINLGDLFVVESFRVRPSKARGLASLDRLWPVEWLGALRYAVGDDRIVEQTPAQGRALKARVKAASEHEADALRHLHVYLYTYTATKERLTKAIHKEKQKCSASS